MIGFSLLFQDTREEPDTKYNRRIQEKLMKNVSKRVQNTNVISMP